MMDERLIQILIDSFSKILLPGIMVTIPLTVISFSIAMIIAIIVAMIQFAKIPVLRQIARFYIWIVRGTPLLVQLYVVFFGLPKLGVIIDPFPCAVLVFSINEGAYCAETMRAALESVSVGQIEAGYCVGLSFADNETYCVATGIAYCVSTTFKFAYWNGQGYLTCCEYYSGRNVYGYTENSGKNL